MADQKLGNPYDFPLKTTVTLNYGMTLRDYFAALCPVTFIEFLEQGYCDALLPANELSQYCDFRFAYADAMLKARGQ